MKSKLIYVIRDFNGIIADCDIVLLQSIRKVCDIVKVVLCGDFQTEEFQGSFSGMYDDAAMKSVGTSDYQILQEEIFSGKEREYDELLFLNNSVFGPFYPLEGIVAGMRTEGYDYWGLTKVGKVINDQWQVYPEHLQLYFFAVESKMLFSQELKYFFEKEIDADQFEMEFTQYFDAKGFRRGTYIDLAKYDANSVTNNINLLYDVACELISQHRFPFLKKDYFVHKDMSNSNATDLKDCMAYLEGEELYPVDFIWDYVLGNYNISQIKDSMQLNYILSEENSEAIKGITEEDYQKAAVVIHLAYEESVDEVCRYVKEIPKEIRKFFVVINEKLEYYLAARLSEWQSENFEIRVMVPNRGRDMNSLFVVCRDVWQEYTYLCFTHDKRTSGDTGAYTVGKEFMNILWENTLKSHSFITRVLALLKREKRLGYLSVPAPYHSWYCETAAKAWTKSYEATVDLAKKLHLKVDISEEFVPFALGNAFWCKTDALRDIINLNLQTNDFSEEPMPRDGTISHALERIMIYAAQNAGYYSGILEASSYAQGELNNKNYMIKKIMEKILIQPQFCAGTTFQKLMRIINDDTFIKFLEKKKRLYIWGAGKTGANLALNLEKLGYKIQGYICSDGYKKPVDGEKDIYYLSEVDFSNEEVGIVLAMHKKFYPELKPVLERIKESVYYI